MRSIARTIAAALALFCVSSPALADGVHGSALPDVAAPPVRTAPAPQTPASETPVGRTGEIAFDDITLTVPQGWRLYSAEEAHAYLRRNNAAAPAGAVLGLLARAGEDIRAPGAWATVISYDAIGYVQPETASGLTDANFEADVRAARQRQSRVFEGFFTAPVFDPATPHLLWAERTALPGAGGADARHEQKALGRYGVAGLTALGSADQMPAIEAAAADLRAMLSFPAGRRHSEFQAATDQVSAYSVPGLVTGVPTAQPQVAAAEPLEAGQTSFGGLSGWFPWIAIGVVVLAAAGFALSRRRRPADVDQGEA